MNLEIINLGNEFTHYQAIPPHGQEVKELKLLNAKDLFDTAKANNGIGFYNDYVGKIRYDVFDGSKSSWLEVEDPEDNWKVVNHCLFYLSRVIIDEAYYLFGLNGEVIRVVTNPFGIQYTYHGNSRYAQLVIEIQYKLQWKPIITLGNSHNPITKENFHEHLTPVFYYHKGINPIDNSYDIREKGSIELLSPWSSQTRKVIYYLCEDIVEHRINLSKPLK